jgi:indolepyruvate ferredoxin oxidoreductase, beta subunit
MKSDIILAGVGGQGILSIAATIGMAALENNLFLKQAEVHGMSQRGGAVQSHLRISDSVIASDLIPMGKADLILSVEPMESLRYLPWLAEKGWLVTNSEAFINTDHYPEISSLLYEIKTLPNHIIINADQIAKKINARRSSNIVMLGAASRFIPIPVEVFYKGIKSIFERKGGDLVKINIIAFNEGRNASESYLNNK